MMNTTQKAAVSTIENAGKYLVQTRDLRTHVMVMTAVEAAYSSNPDLQAFAVMSVLLARIARAKDDGWVAEICSTLGIPEGR